MADAAPPELTSKRKRPVGVKRAEILSVATEYFGRQGYEDTKWGDVAAAVGVGSTALYHYFESKLHCLYVILADALEDFYNDFERATEAHDDFVAAVTAISRGGYGLTEREILRNRVLVAEQGLVSVRRSSPREEESRQLARSRIRRLELAWAAFLARGMEQGAIPRTDPELLTRAILGFYTSVWHWYRPGGALNLDELGEFFVARTLAMIGVPDTEAPPV
jgi:TetR/AcrR family transcriptional regulator, cholesterol catabolism regulator